MSRPASRPAFRAERGLLVRSVLLHQVPLPPAPDLMQADANPEPWLRWVLQVWEHPQVAAAIRYANPDFAREVQTFSQSAGAAEVRRLALTLLSYVLRLARPTPFGLFAGIAEGHFGARTDVRWGQAHFALARADGEWLAAVVQQLEGLPEVRRGLRLTANTALLVRGHRLVLPWQPRALEERGTAVREVSVRHTAAVHAAVRMTRALAPYREVAAALAAAHPELGLPGAEELLDLLIGGRMLLTSLQPTSTEPDPLGHVVRQLASTVLAPSSSAASLIASLREIHEQIDSLSQFHQPAEAERRRIAVIEGMRRIANQPTPLAVDVRIDADLTIPRAVAWEAQAAAAALARLTPEPRGTQAWTRYRARFLARYGPGVLVPLVDLLDPHVGLGLPEDFHGTARAPQPLTHRRDRLLMALAHRALAAGDELVLDEDLIERLAGPTPATASDAPAHLELSLSVQAASAQALDAGEFTLAVRRVGRGWGHLSGGRFATLLADGPSELLESMARRPTTVRDALPVQVAFPPLLPRALHITNTPRLNTHLVSLSEARESDPDLIALDDLAVTWHEDRLHLVWLSRRQVLEAATPHPLQLECQTPGIARFLDEMQRGQSSRLMGSVGNLGAWDWGAARHLPILPRVRVGRSILSPATWPLAHTGLPGAKAPADAWEEAFAALRERWRLPRHVYLEDWDTRLRLDLEQAAHRALLRSHLDRPRSLGHLSLLEAEPENAYGWCGGRPHEIVTRLSSMAPARPAPPLRQAPLVEPEAHTPGASPYLCAQLDYQEHTQHAFLADHLPALTAALPGSIWWLTPREDGQTMLTVRLADASQAAPALRTLGQWTRHLIAAGAISDVALTPYRPHIGLWGSGAALGAAEEVWAADSAVLAYQHAHQHILPPAPVLAAVSVLAISAGFHQDHATGRRWVAAQPKPATTEPLPEALVDQTRTIAAAPDDTYAALRATPSGSGLIHGPWVKRHAALGRYHCALQTTVHTDATTVLRALVTAHLHLAGEPAEGTAWRLARTVALASARPRHKPAA
ncbi:lantibiotic dehydratase [Streptomyces sp. AC563]|uniref:lantibiotic dehydratase n=1 Tax=Streptomyces buecherae TaxID=2763006 RepID=UPI00164D421A|nr:lantibiotic dehydratase [Streptomyces buecherae]MBC3990402.1 lantibiotic dehydratase [Streptomyces buecherae]